MAQTPPAANDDDDGDSLDIGRRRAAARAVLAGSHAATLAHLDKAASRYSPPPAPSKATDAARTPDTNNSDINNAVSHFQHRIDQARVLMHIYLDAESMLNGARVTPAGPVDPQIQSAAAAASSMPTSNAADASTVDPSTSHTSPASQHLQDKSLSCIRTSTLLGNDKGWAQFDVLVRQAYDEDTPARNAALATSTADAQRRWSPEDVDHHAGMNGGNDDNGINGDGDDDHSPIKDDYGADDDDDYGDDDVRNSNDRVTRNGRVPTADPTNFTYTPSRSSKPLPPLISDSAAPAYNYALLCFELGNPAITATILSPFIPVIETLDYGLALRVCMLLVDACVQVDRVHDAESAVSAIETVLVPICDEAVVSLTRLCKNHLEQESQHQSTLLTQPSSSSSSHSRRQKSPAKSDYAPAPPAVAETMSNTILPFTMTDHFASLARAIPDMYLGSLRLLVAVFRARISLASAQLEKDAAVGRDAPVNEWSSALQAIDRAASCLDDTITSMGRHEASHMRVSPCRELIAAMRAQALWELGRDQDAVDVLHASLGEPGRTCHPSLMKSAAPKVPKSKATSLSLTSGAAADPSTVSHKQRQWPTWAWQSLAAINIRSGRDTAASLCLMRAIETFDSHIGRRRSVDGSPNTVTAHPNWQKLDHPTKHAAVIKSATKLRHVYRGVYARHHATMHLQLAALLRRVHSPFASANALYGILGHGVPFPDRFTVTVHPTTVVHAAIATMRLVDLYWDDDDEVKDENGHVISVSLSTHVQQRLKSIRVDLPQHRDNNNGDVGHVSERRSVMIKIRRLLSRFDYGVCFHYLCTAKSVLDAVVNAYSQWVGLSSRDGQDAVVTTCTDVSQLSSTDQHDIGEDRDSNDIQSSHSNDVNRIQNMIRERIKRLKEYAASS